MTPGETFAYGFRSPYRVTADKLTGEIYIGDVGENTREEISRVANGSNHGWGGYEGTLVFNGGLAAAAKVYSAISE